MTPELAALQAIGWPITAEDLLPADPVWRQVLADHPQARPARVTEQHRSGYVVSDGPDSGYYPPVTNVPKFIAQLYPHDRYVQVFDRGNVYVFRRG